MARCHAVVRLPVWALLAAAALAGEHLHRVPIGPGGDLPFDPHYNDAHWGHGHDHGHHRRVLQESVPQCPTGEPPSSAESQFGVRTLRADQGPGAIALGGDGGYDGYLFCQWKVYPTGRPQQVTLIFDSFDVPCCGRDKVEVFLDECVGEVDEARAGDDKCTQREQKLLIAFPGQFEDAGRLPPIVTATDSTGAGVRLLVRFKSFWATGSEGFVASYTTRAFDLLDVTPKLVPTSLQTSLTLKGAGFSEEATLAEDLICVIKHAPGSGVDVQLHVPAKKPDKCAAAAATTTTTHTRVATSASLTRRPRRACAASATSAP